MRGQLHSNFFWALIELGSIFNVQYFQTITNTARKCQCSSIQRPVMKWKDCNISVPCDSFVLRVPTSRTRKRVITEVIWLDPIMSTPCYHNQHSTIQTPYCLNPDKSKYLIKTNIFIIDFGSMYMYMDMWWWNQLINFKLVVFKENMFASCLFERGRAF